MALSQPLTKETANPNAATAAASAFMRREPSTTLSSAAAAAALKARPITPTNVAEAPSKRVARRSASVTSTRSQDRGGGGRQMRRTPSTGSMTERTFRSPSPGRSPAPQPRDVPPVPNLPKDQAQRPQSGYVTSTNIQTTPFATASQKLKNGQQGTWFGAARAGDGANVRTSDSVLQNAATTVSEPRPGSISPSINFSYPRARHESPAPSNASTSDVVMVYDANSRRMVPKVEKADLLDRHQSVRSASEKPVKKKKQNPTRSGSHLAKGTVDRTIVAPAETLQQVAPKTEAAQTLSQPKPEASEAPRAVTHTPPPAAEAAPQPQQQPQEEEVEDAPIYKTEPETPLATDPTPEPKAIVADPPVAAMPAAPDPPSGPLLHKKPSTVLEEPEEEDEEGGAAVDENVSRTDYAAIDAVPVRSSQPKPSPSPEPSHIQLEHITPRDSVRRTRVHSESPARSPGRAHFAGATDQLVVRHEPPPRSLSPRKSALKQSSSVRGASPSDDSSEASGPLSAHDAAQARKKAVRVSFNEDYNVVLGESAEPQENESPVVLSPQVKHKPWRAFMNRSKKESNSYDEEETMSPRPALPLFGSVREKKSKEPDNERPLVRPSERAYSPPAQSSISPGTSADSAISSILAQESSTRNEANISKTREPLPPIVQSVEGSGYVSMSESSEDELDEANTHKSSQTIQSSASIATDATSQDVTPHTDTGAEFVETQQDDKVIISSPHNEAPPPTVKDSDALVAAAAAKPNEETKSQDTYIPSISVQTATPPARSQVPESPDKEYFDVPGGFPTDHSGYSASSGDESSKIVTKPAESVPAVSGSVVPPSPTKADMVMDDIAEEEESDHSSIYSDAYEDLSDVGADGFMSLDAVLEAPPKSQVSRLYEKTVSESKAQASAGNLGLSAGVHEEPMKTPDDWENAKAYWRSLTVEKRRQLEKEAIEEAGEEADQEAISKPKKNKKRRSVDRPPSVLKNASTESEPNPERIYQIQPGSSWTPDGSQSQSRDSSPPVAQAAPAKGFRKSMRAEQPPKLDTTPQGNGSMRKTLRSNGSAGDANAASRNTGAARPASYHVGAAIEPPKTARRALSSDGRPVSSSGLASVGMKPSLRRRGSDSSESSFKRSRSNTGEGFGFRRTMRAQSQEPESPRAAAGSGRFSIRSLSPTGSPFRRSTPAPSAAAPSMGMGGGRMRTSLRAAPSEPKDKSRFSTFGRSSGKKAKKGLGGSRFADSSDEESGRPTLFSTRFGDSSDEDESLPPPSRNGGLAAKTMRSSKGPAPAAAGSLRLGRQVRSDSPDLPDSDDELPQATPDRATNGHARPVLQRSRSGRGSLNSGSPAVLSTAGVGERPTHQRRGSFMSSILRRKKDSGGKISRDVGESVARRDTRLERSTDELAVIRSNSSGHPRLQKRGPSWPLPDETGDNSHVVPELPSPGVEPQRPATSSGPNATAPRGFLKRRSLSAQQVPPVPALPQSQIADLPPERSQVTDVPPDATLKKKKFGTLRKIFGLND